MSLALAIEAMPSDPAANGSSLCLGYGYRGDVSGDLEMVSVVQLTGRCARV